MSLMSRSFECFGAKFHVSARFFGKRMPQPENGPNTGAIFRPRIGGAKGEGRLLTFTFCAPYFGPENGPIFGPGGRGAGSVSSRARRPASARGGRKARTLGLLTCCVVFVNFIVPPVRPVVLGSRVPPAQYGTRRQFSSYAVCARTRPFLQL